MSQHERAHDEHAPNVKLYMMVFGALMVLTVVTVWISKFHLEVHEAVGLGMLVATVKAGLVAAVFMHLWGEKKLIFYMLGLTVFFGAFLAIGLADSRMTRERRYGPVDVKAQGPQHAAAHGEEHAAPAPAEPAPMEKTAPGAGAKAKGPKKGPGKH